MKKLICILSFLLFVFFPLTAGATELTPIYTVEDLFRLAENQTGSYILMNDLDLSEREWTPVDFSGSFDGNGHALLNLKVSAVSSETRIGYDGNRKEYETHFGGFFGIMENASVTNLTIVGASISYESDSHTFLGILAGYVKNCNITNCKINGQVELKCSAKFHGVAGIAGLCGFNNDDIDITTFENNSVDVTLINIDTNKAEKDEEFMAGITCIGYPEIRNCTVKIDGYISDHGYVHSGGVIGLYLKPLNRKKDYVGYLTNITVSGRIKFFEDNNDPRGYCNGIIGEMLNRCDNMNGNDTSGFTPLQLRQYDKDLYPHDCDAGDEYTTTVVAPTCSEFGYTELTCRNCGYTRKLFYTLHNHVLSEVKNTLTPPTLENEGFGEFVCSECGTSVYAELAKLTPTPTPSPEPTATPEPTKAATPTVAVASPTQIVNEKPGSSNSFLKILLVLVAIGVFITIAIISSRLNISRNEKIRNRNNNKGE